MKKIILLLFLAIFSLVFVQVDAKNSCTFEYNPVVGTDGKTYANPCLAEKSGVFSKQKIDIACPAIYMPIVINGVTYSNECVARASGAYDLKIDNKKILNSYLDFSISFPSFESDSKIFLEKYGKICQTASDGVNTFFIKDEKISGGTKIGVGKNFQPEYSCIVYNKLNLDDENKKNFQKSLEKLEISEIKKINSALKNFYAKEKDFLKNFEKSVLLLEKIDKIKQTSKFSSEKSIAIFDYIKYQVLELFVDKYSKNH